MGLHIIKTSTGVNHFCYLPAPRDNFLVAWDIIDKLKEYESETICDILYSLIAWFPEVSGYLVKNHIDLLTEEE